MNRRRPDTLGQLTLPFRIPAKEWFGPREAGEVLGLSERTVETLYQSGQVSGHAHNAASGKRNTLRIPRVWLVAYAVRTSDYDDASLLEAYLLTLPRLPPASLLRIAAEATKAAANQPLRR